MPTTGVTGGAWRADVTPAGTIEPWDGSPLLAWFVAADDRWHDPATDSGVRHRRVDGTAVFETKVRIPSGDAVQRIWSVPDHGGVTLIEIANESPLPIAVAFTRGDLLTTRPPTDVPIQGIDLPAGSIVVPIGHRTSVTVGLAHERPSPGALPSGLPGAEAVGRGWIVRTDAASRLDLPDAALVEAVRAARCEAALGATERPRGTDSTAPGDGDRAGRYLLLIGELVRMGELDGQACGQIAPEVADAVAKVAAGWGPLATAALGSAGVALAAAEERRALKDLGRVMAAHGDAPAAPIDGELDAAGLDTGDIATVAAVEGRLAAGPHLFPAGLPASWLGQNLEAHGLVTGPTSTLSVALRWHGENVAVLWEQSGEPVTLTSGVDPTWRTDAPSGEALWRVARPGATVGKV